MIYRFLAVVSFVFVFSPFSLNANEITLNDYLARVRGKGPDYRYGKLQEQRLGIRRELLNPWSYGYLGLGYGYGRRESWSASCCPRQEELSFVDTGSYN